MKTPEQIKEWLSALHVSNGADSDLAKKALELVHERDDFDAELDQLLETLGDFDKAEVSLGEYASLKEWAKGRDEIDGSEKLEDALQIVLDEAADAQRELHEIYELMVSAGVLADDDLDSHPVDILRMFLPVE